MPPVTADEHTPVSRHPLFPRQSLGGITPGFSMSLQPLCPPFPLSPQMAQFSGCLHVRVRRAQAS